MTVGALVLAAGRSRRFGSDKRRFLLDGKPLLQHTVEAVLEAGLPCRVCLRPGEGDLSLLLNLPGVVYQECDRADEGMGATLAQGVAACSDWLGLLVVLGDMAWVQPGTLAMIARALDDARIVQPHYRGRPGQPVGFGRNFFPELELLRGDRGGRSLLVRHGAALCEVPVDDPGIHRDLDRRDGSQH